MPKLILTLFLFFALSYSYGQHFSVVELIELNKRNWNDFDTYVLKKGYDFQETNNEDDHEERTYAVNANNSGYSTYFISKTVSKNIHEKYVTYQTTSSKDYLSIKEELKRLNFIYLKSGQLGKFTVYYYKKGLIQLEIYVGRSKTSWGKIITSYEIDLGKGLPGYDK